MSRVGGRLCGVLSDGEHLLLPLSAPWPPPDGTPGLPAELRGALQDRARVSLRLQLDPGLDDWPWEAELDPAHRHVLTRRLVVAHDAQSVEGVEGRTAGVAVPLGSASARDALWLQGDVNTQPQPGLQADLALLQVVAGTDQARASLFRAAVCSFWGPGEMLSQATQRAACAVGLPREAWRQYGDARFCGVGEETSTQWRQVSSLSLDLVESTVLLQALGAEGYAERHARLHARCRAVVQAHGGRVDDPQGDDGWMAYFGLLQAREDSALQAIRCGWALLQEARALGCALRAGVATGRVAVSAGQPFGLKVHLAARLQRAAHAGSLVLCAATHDLLGAAALREPLERALAIPGVEVPVSAWRLTGLAPQASPQPQRAAAGPFVGRRQELRRLDAAWRSVCQQRRGQWHCISGEPGVGKSRLLQEFVQRSLAGQGAHTLLRLNGRAGAQASAYEALALALRASALDALAGLLPDAAPGLHQQDRPQLQSSLLQGLCEMARSAPLCCLVDDTHWLDPSTVELLRLLHDALPDLPVLVVACVHEQPTGLDMRLRRDEVWSLRPLDAQESCALLEAVAGPLAPEVLAGIAARSGGIPLFLEETARMVLRPGTTGEDVGQRIPASLQDVLTARLDSLGPARALVQLAAVLGDSFTLAVWRQVLQEDDPWTLRARAPMAWERAMDSGLLERVTERAGTHEAVYRFRHGLIRQAAYESMAQRDRRRLHRLVARVLAHHDVDTLSTRVQRAQHLAAADEPRRAFKLLSQSARDAAAAASDREALALARQALDLLGHLAVSSWRRRQALQLHLLCAGRAIALEGHAAPGVEQAYRHAFELLQPEDGPELRIRIELGQQAVRLARGDLEGARSLAAKAVRETAWERNLRLALQARWAWMSTAFLRGDLHEALETGRQCLKHYHPGLHQRAAVQDPGVMCLCFGAWALAEAGCADEARTWMLRAVTLAERLNHRFSQALAHGLGATVAQLLGDVAGGLRHAQQALQLCDASTFAAWGPHALVMRGRLKADAGDAAAGLRDIEEGLMRWTGTGARIAVTTYLAMQAEVLLQLGRPAQALEVLEDAASRSRSQGDRHQDAELLRLRARAVRLAADAGDGEAAETAEPLLRSALALARSRGQLGHALRAALELGRLLAAQGRAEQAAAELHHALQAAPGHAGTADALAASQALSRWQVGA